jgi:hypothetical protein
MSIANVTLTNTFDEWRTVTNQIITYVNQIDGNQLLSLGPSLANTARDAANAAYSLANAGIIQANTARNGANDAYVLANSGIIQANAAYDQANTARNGANVAYVLANSGIIQANAAYNQANTARDHANSAFEAANSGSSAAQAFTQANTARDHANTAFSQANAAYNKANTGSGASIPIQTDSINASRYVIFTDQTSGLLANANVATGLSYNPSSGRLTANTLKSSGLYDSNNRLLLIKDANSAIVWGN